MRAVLDIVIIVLDLYVWLLIASAITWLRHAKPEGRSVVEPGGIEPPTSSLRTTRSPS